MSEEGDTSDTSASSGLKEELPHDGRIVSVRRWTEIKLSVILLFYFISVNSMSTRGDKKVYIDSMMCLCIDINEIIVYQVLL